MTVETEQTEARTGPGHGRPGTIAQYQALTGLSVNSIRQAIAADEIKVIRLGRRILIPGSEFDKLAGRAA